MSRRLQVYNLNRPFHNKLDYLDCFDVIYILDQISDKI